MITHFLGLEEVTAYCSDFVRRLGRLDKKDLPKVWCPIGTSGEVLALVILEQISKSGDLPPEMLAEIVIQPIAYRKPTDTTPGTATVMPQEGQSEEDAVASLSVALAAAPNALVIDSSIHSGSSMLGVFKLLTNLGARNCQSYALVIKQSSGFIPHYFGLVVGDHDRTLFLLEQIPNNRLAKPGTSFPGVLRKLSEQDVESSDKLETGVESISKIGWGDLWYDVKAHGFQVYVTELDGRLAGFVKYKIDQSGRLKLDVIAVDESFKGVGVGGALFRWTETVARANSCPAIELWGIENQVKRYEDSGYEGTGRWIDTGANEKYQYMSKPLLYHFNLAEMQN